MNKSNCTLLLLSCWLLAASLQAQSETPVNTTNPAAAEVPTQVAAPVSSEVPTKTVSPVAGVVPSPAATPVGTEAPVPPATPVEAKPSAKTAIPEKATAVEKVTTTEGAKTPTKPVIPLKAEPLIKASTQTLTLQQACQFALMNHPAIKAANFQAEAAAQKIREARSGFYPQVSADINAIGSTDNARITASGGLNNPSVYNRQSDGLLVTQLITDFGHTANLTSGYRFGSEAAQQNARTVRDQVLLRVNQAYFVALGAQALLAVARETVTSRELILQQVTALAKSNLKSSLDVNFAEVDLQEGQLMLLQAQDRVNEAFASLAAAMGTEDCQQYTLQEVKLVPMFPQVDNLIQKALADRPEVIAAKADRDAAVKFAAAAREEQYPQVNAIGAVGITPVGDSELSKTYAAGGINVNVPLLNGGNLSARSREAELKERAAERMLDDEENQVARDVRVAWLQAATAKQKIGVTEKLFQTASQALALAKSRYNIGISSIVELSQAELEKTHAEIAHTESIYDYEIKKIALDYQIGSLSI